MDFTALLIAVFGTGTLGTAIVATVRGWRQRQRAHASTPYLEDALKKSRLIWREYAYALRGHLSKHSCEPPPVPDDPYEDALRHRDSMIITPPKTE